MKILGKTDEDGLDLGVTEMYTLALPGSLTLVSFAGTLSIQKQFQSRYRPGVDRVASYELVRTLLDLLQSHFATVSSIIVCGGSNMLKILPNFTVLDLTVRYQAGHLLKITFKLSRKHSKHALTHRNSVYYRPSR
jgi:hypothetical protein